MRLKEDGVKRVISQNEDEELRRVRALYRAGRFADARALLNQRRDAAGLIELARIEFSHANDPNTAFGLLSRAIELATDANDLVLARALRDLVGASLERGQDLIDSSCFTEISTETHSEVIYLIALAAYMRQQYVTAVTWLNSHVPRYAPMRAKFMLLRGLIAAAEREDFRTQAREAESALIVLETEAPEELHLIASAAETLAYLARELPTISGISRIERLSRSLTWDEGIADAHFQILRTLAWTKAISDNYRGAVLLLTRASWGASTDLMRFYLHLDRAAVAIFGGQAHHARAEFDVAHALSEEIPWDSVGRGHIAALPLAAHVAAEVGAFAEAEMYCNRALEKQSRLAKHYSLAHGSRMRALIGEAIALTYLTKDRARAAEEAARSYKVFERGGFSLRAARMALLLFQITRKPVWEKHAADHLAAYRDAPIAALLGLRMQLRTLTTRLESVLDLVLLGYDTDRIAEMLDLAPDTIRRHLGRLHRHFHVKNRLQLIAKLANARATIG